MKALAFGLILLASPALADDGPCRLVSDLRAENESDQGASILLTREQFEFLRGVYVLNPATPPGLPPGDHAILLKNKDGAGIIAFVDGEKACAGMPVPKEMVDLVMEVGAGVVKHIGDGL